jgi:uncharacterized protein YkwD
VEDVPARSNLVEVRSAVLCLVNLERSRRELEPLRSAVRLRDAATHHSADMVRRGYFGHLTPGGAGLAARLARVGLRPAAAAENIAWGLGAYSTALSIVDGWMRSPVHRANILSRRYTFVGIGVVLGAPGHESADQPTATYTQVFAGR